MSFRTLFFLSFSKLSKIYFSVAECLYRNPLNQRPNSCRPFNSGIPTIGGIIRQKTALQTELEMTPKEFLNRCKSAPGSSRSGSKPFVFQKQFTFYPSQCRENQVQDQPKRPSTCHVVSSRSDSLVLTNKQMTQSRKTPHNSVDRSSGDRRTSQNDSSRNSLTEAVPKEGCDDEKDKISSVLNNEKRKEARLTSKQVRSLALKEAELYNPDSYGQNLRKNGWLMQVEGNVLGLK